MYRLLLATDRPEIRAAFESVGAWEKYNFKTPRIADSAQSAIDTLTRHRADAIAIALPPEETDTLNTWLTENRPYLPIMEAPANAEQLAASMAELVTLLNRTHLDFSNDSVGVADMMQLCRHDFFRQLLGGKLQSEHYIRSHMRLLRSRMDPDRPCVILDLAIPEDSDFLTVRWHYGNERLETALRNFFGAELDGMRILISVLPDQQIRLLCCPMLGEEVRTESITEEVTAHAEQNIASVKEFLGVDLRISNITVLPSLTALAKEA